MATCCRCDPLVLHVAKDFGRNSPLRHPAKKKPYTIVSLPMGSIKKILSPLCFGDRAWEACFNVLFV